MGPSKPLPRRGAKVRISYFGGDVQTATVVGIHDHGRRLEVACAGDGELLEFVLSRATARYVAADAPHGPRLELLDDVEEDH